MGFHWSMLPPVPPPGRGEYPPVCPPGVGLTLCRVMRLNCTVLLGKELYPVR